MFKVFPGTRAALAAGCWLLALAPARGGDWSVERYGREQGLENLTVNAICRDTRGYVWIGTRRGLCRYDGIHLRNVALPDSGDPRVEENQVHAIAETSDSTLWVSTDTGDFAIDPRTGRVRRLGIGSGLKNYSTHTLCPDAQGGVWMLAWDCVVYRNAARRQTLVFPCRGAARPRQAHVTRRGAVWLSFTDGTLRRYDSRRRRFVPVRLPLPGNPPGSITCMQECDDDRLLLVCNARSAYLYTPATGEAEQLFAPADFAEPLVIHTMATLDGTRVWMGSETGIHIYDVAERRFTDRIAKNFGGGASLSDNAVYVLTPGGGDCMWAGTYFNGANRIRHGTPDFRHLRMTDGEGRAVANIIREICRDAQGQVWVGSEDGGLALLDPASHTLRRVELAWQGRAVSKNIQGLCADGGRLWVCTFDGGLYALDVLTRKVVAHYGAADGLASNTLVCIRRTSGGALLVGTIAGACWLDPASGRFRRIEGLGAPFAHAIYEDRQHRVWLGTLGSGLYRLTRTADGRWAGRRTEYPYPSATTIFQDSRHRLWVGSKRFGLVEYDPQAGQARTAALASGRQQVTVSSVAEGAGGKLWVGTFSGLYRYDAERDEAAHYGMGEGLPYDLFNYHSSYQDLDGRIYMGTYDGLIDFAPAALSDRPADARAEFTDLIVGSQAAPAAASVFAGLRAGKASVPEDSVFSIHYAVPGQAWHTPLWFRYRLRDGAPWQVAAADKGGLHFTRLSPGTYRLEVQATSDPTQWDGEAGRLELTVRPTFLHSPAFRVLLGALAAALLAALAAGLYLRKRREYRERIVVLQNEHLKEILQARVNFFTTITHEIRTPLTLISGCCDRLRAQAGQLPDARETLRLLRRNTNRLLALVNQLLDFRKIESKQLPMNFVLLDAAEVVREQVENFRPLVEKRGIELALRGLDGGRRPVMADRDSLVKMVSNILSNACKFCERRVAVSLTEASEAGQREVVLRVSNDGPRIPPGQAERIFQPFEQYYANQSQATIQGSGLGVPLTRSLAQLHNGRFYLDDKEAALNSFVLCLPAYQPMRSEAADERPDGGAEREDGDATAGEGRRPSVLLVDDERDLREFVAQELDAKYRVLQAGNGQEALDVLREQGVALVVSDIMMPVMDGIRLCARLKSDFHTCHIPIVMLTAKTSFDDYMSALRTQADAYIQKPFSTQHLLAQIDNLISNRELIRQTFIHSPFALTSDVAVARADGQFLEKMDAFINGNISRDELSVEFVADHMCMSVSTLYRKVKGVTSLSPNSYIRLCRLKRAARMLGEGLGVREVSERLNFSSASYFTSCFMKQFGITPGEFARQARKS